MPIALFAETRMDQTPEEFRRDVIRALVPGRAFDRRPLPRVGGGLATMACGITVFFTVAALLV